MSSAIYIDEEYSTDEELSLRGRVITRRVNKTRRVRRMASGSSSSGGGSTNSGNSGSGGTAPPALRKKGLSKWGVLGLDISDPGFSKLQSKEMRFEESSRTRYDLGKEKFSNWRTELTEKVNRMYARKDFSANDTTGSDCFILTEYTKLTEVDLTTVRNNRWPAADPTTFTTQDEWDAYTDSQIKASTVGAYIHDSLTTEAKKQLKADETFFKVTDADGNHFFDGPCYFWKISEIVDPNNDALVEGVRTRLRHLNVKNFNYSVILMLAEFKNLRTRIIELGGSYSADEQFLDMWSCLKTMKEKEFARYVKQEKDEYRDTPRATRKSVDHYITKFGRKETAMKEDDEWNAISPEEGMILALVSMIEEKTKPKQKKESEKKPESVVDDKDDKEPKKPLSQEEKQRLKETRIPDWKKVAPKEDEPTQKVVEGRTYYWCKHCRQGKGMWALHKVHDFKFKPNGPKSGKDTDKSSKVSFSSDTKKDDGNAEPSIKVNKELLNNAKSYLASLGKGDF
jgi:hypothetical protein